MQGRFENIDRMYRVALDKILKKHEKIFGAEYIEVLYNDIRNIVQEESGWTTAAIYMTDLQTRKILRTKRKLF